MDLIKNGNLLRKLRKEKSLTQKELADTLGVNRATVSKYESGVIEPSISQLKEIAEKQNISKKYLEQIIPILNRSGILMTNRGYKGGYKLAKDPSKITIAEILRNTEGSLAPVACLEQNPNQWPRCNECLTLTVWIGLEKVVKEYLEGITLQNIIDNIKKDNIDYII